MRGAGQGTWESQDSRRVRQTDDRGPFGLTSTQGNVPVVFNSTLIADFATLTSYAPKRDALVRAAIANLVFSLEGSARWTQARIWNAIGRWNAPLAEI